MATRLVIPMGIRVGEWVSSRLTYAGRRGVGMDVELRIATDADDSDSLDALYDWLSDEEELRGRVSAAPRPIGAQELGSLPDLLTVALGAGGAGSVLASSLRTWLQSRRTAMKITMTVADRSITVDLQNIDDAAPLLERILKAGSGD